jgi:polysaccharide deacetylase family protein (PEP-CTERM system associated)
MTRTNVTNALTVDVEDYFHVSAFADTIDRADWDHYEPRVERNTYKLLDIFDQQNCKATFFVLGWVAERCPRLVRDIAARNHEIACHGFSHQLIYAQTPEVFRTETVRAKGLLEDTVQSPVYGYRGASFSVTRQSAWALDILVELGFSYDSSIFPTHHDRYGLPGVSPFPHRLTTPGNQSLVEFPLSTISVLGYRLPVAGGGYFRLYPYGFTRAALGHINSRHKRPFVFYLHPWEIDPDQPRIQAGWASRFRHYNNLHKCERRVNRLLDEFRFATVKDILGDLGLLAAAESKAAVPRESSR